MAAHKHAKLMAEYAKDAMETDMPWVRWQAKISDSKDSLWHDLVDHPSWLEDTDFRRKPQMMHATCADGTVVEWSEPERIAPERETKYYYAILDNDGAIGDHYWINDALDNILLKNGMLHLTYGAAKKQAKALLALSNGSANFDKEKE